MTYWLILVVSVLVLIPGIFMALAPGIPGILYMLVIAFLAAFLDGFIHISAWDIGVLAILAVAVLLVDFFSGIVGAKVGGAHWSSIIWGFVGLVAGSLIIPIPVLGSLAGMFLGVLVSELYRTKDVRRANKAAVGSFWGWLAGTGFKIGASVVFLFLFVILFLI